jgi:hypothetical protein
MSIEWRIPEGTLRALESAPPDRPVMLLMRTRCARRYLRAAQGTPFPSQRSASPSRRIWAAESAGGSPP